MKNFAPCEGFDSKKLKKEFAEFGTKADLNDLADAFTPKLGMEMLIQCKRWLKDVLPISHQQKMQ